MTLTKNHWLSLCFILIVVGLWRLPIYFSSEGGYQTSSADILNHYYVTEAILHGELFPDWNKGETSQHAVSNHLPVYHGLILAHSLASVFVLAGFPLPGSLQMISDLFFGLSFFILFLLLPAVSWTYRVFLAFTALTLTGYVYMIQLYGASYSQTVGMALGLLLLYLIKQQKAPRLCLLLLFFSAFAYPDTILVLAPLVGWQLWGKNLRIEVAIVSLLWMACLWIFVRRFSLQGPLNIDFSASCILILMLFGYKFFFGSEPPRSLEKKLLISYTGLLLVLMVYSLVTQQQLNYYLNKFTAWSYFILPLALLSIRDWKKQFLLIFLFVVSFSSGLGEEGERKANVFRFLKSEGSVLLNNQSWRELNEIFNTHDLPNFKQITPWFSEEDTKELKISIAAAVAIGRGYNLTSILANSQIFASFNQEKLMSVTHLNQMPQKVGELGEVGRKKALEQLRKFPGEILILPRKFWTEDLANEFKSVQTARLVAIWHN